MLEKVYRSFSNDIGIDLGTANTLVYVRGEGIIINEPSIVALNHKTGRVVAIGKEAKQMVGRTPAHIGIVRPLVEGVISDFEITEEMLSYFLKKVRDLSSRRMIGPRLMIGVPSEITNVERRAVRDAGINAGARIVHIIEEPMAAAIGIGLPVLDPVGSMIVDIGGGTTDIAVISLGGIVRSKNLKIAGDRFNSDIMTYVRDEFKMLLGDKTAEDVKIAVSSACFQETALETIIKGRDLVTGLPREVVITDVDIREAMLPSLSMLVSSVKEVLEITPPEVVSDIMNRGIVVSGGGAMIRGLQEVLEKELNLPVYIANDPLTAVVRGTGIVLEDIGKYREVLLDEEDEIPPR